MTELESRIRKQHAEFKRHNPGADRQERFAALQENFYTGMPLRRADAWGDKQLREIFDRIENE